MFVSGREIQVKIVWFDDRLYALIKEEHREAMIRRITKRGDRYTTHSLGTTLTITDLVKEFMATRK